MQNSRWDRYDAFVPYLALIYFDRFISHNPPPVIHIKTHDSDFPYTFLIIVNLFNQNLLMTQIFHLFNQNLLSDLREEVVLIANCCLKIAWEMRDSTFRPLDFLVNYYAI